MRLLFTALLALLPVTIFAQSNYHPGYVLKNNSDTIKGYIDYREWTQCPTSIDFKINKEDSHAFKFTPRTAKGFQVNGLATYLRYRGFITMDRTKFPDLPLMRDTSKKLDTVFLKQVVAGNNLALFSHQDEIKTRFFVAEKSQIIELKYSQYYGIGNQPVENNTYKGQLIVYIHEFLPGNSRLNSKAEHASYNEGDLREIISEINGSSNLIIQKRSFFRLFAGVGLSSIETELHDNIHRIEKPVTESTVTNLVVVPLQITQHTTTVSPKAIFGIDFFTNPDVQRLVFRAELSLFYAKGDFHYDIYDPGAHGNIQVNYSFNQYSATLTPQILYNIFNKDNFKFYIDGGIGLNFSTYTKKGTEFDDLNSFWPTFPVQAGITLNKKIEFSVCYSGYAYLTQFGDGPYNIKNKSIGAGFKYLFGSK